MQTVNLIKVLKVRWIKSEISKIRLVLTFWDILKAMLTTELERMGLIIKQKNTDIDKVKHKLNESEYLGLDKDR